MKQRDAEHRESLSSTLRTARTDLQRQATEQARQAEQLERAQQQLEASEARARALEGQLRAAERGAQKLRDEEQRARSLAAQTRAACARDLRRRDRLVEDLRRAVVDAGRVRRELSRDVVDQDRELGHACAERVKGRVARTSRVSAIWPTSAKATMLARI